MTARIVLPIACVLSLAGCAGAKVRLIPDAATDARVEGVRYYEPAPFILVFPDGKGGLDTSLIYLPDTTRKLAVRPYALLAKNKTTLNFTGGVLDDAESVVDETVIPAALIEAAKSVVLKRINPAADEGGGAFEVTVPPPALFRVYVDEDGIQLRGAVQRRSRQAPRRHPSHRRAPAGEKVMSAHSLLHRALAAALMLAVVHNAGLYYQRIGQEGRVPKRSAIDTRSLPR